MSLKMKDTWFSVSVYSWILFFNSSLVLSRIIEVLNILLRGMSERKKKKFRILQKKKKEQQKALSSFNYFKELN